MKFSELKLKSNLLVFCLFFILAFSFSSSASTEKKEKNYIEGDVLVIFKAPENEKVTASSLRSSSGGLRTFVNSAAKSAGASVKNIYEAISESDGSIFVHVRSENKTTEELIQEFKKRDDVILVTPNHLAKTNALRPNDARYNDLWGMEKIKAPEVWGEGYFGSDNVYVAVMDSGVYPNEDLINNIAMDFAQSFSVSQDWNEDIVKHGTHVAGTIGAVGNNGIGVAGVNWKVKIIPLKIDNGEGDIPDANVIDAVNYLVSLLNDNPEMKLAAVNMSFDFYENYSPEDAPKESMRWRAMKTLDRLNRTLLVAACGNEGIETGVAAPFDQPEGLYNKDEGEEPSFRKGQIAYPASYEGLNNLIVVGAVTSEDKAAFFSCWGDKVDISAPGLRTLSTSTTNGEYIYMSGTSMAAPHVTGAAALLMSIYPDAKTSQIKAALIEGADKNNNPFVYPFDLNDFMKHLEYGIDDAIREGELPAVSRDERLESRREYYSSIIPGLYAQFHGKGKVSRNGLLDVKAALDLLGEKISNAEDLTYPVNEYYDNYEIYENNNNNYPRYRRGSGGGGGCNAGFFGINGKAGLLIIGGIFIFIAVLKIKKSYWLFIFVIISFSSPAFGGKNYVEGEALVVFKAPENEKITASSLRTSSSTLRTFLNSAVKDSGASVKNIYESLSESDGSIFVHVRSENKTTEELIQELKKRDDVLLVSPNHLRRPRALRPNDPRYKDLWGIEKINAPEVWGEGHTGSENIYVAIIDTGVALHDDLAGNIATDLARSFSDVEDWNEDIIGHGTHIAGTIGALANNNIGVAGVNWKVKIIPLKTDNEEGNMPEANVVAAINYLVSLLNSNPEMKIAAVNMSYGGYVNFSPEQAPQMSAEWRAMKTLDRLNRTLMIVAAGNEGLEVSSPAPFDEPEGLYDEEYGPTFKRGYYNYPPAYEGLNNLITVGAVTSDDTGAYFTCWGEGVDISAPGYRILSTYPDNKIPYYYMGGTSMATPHVVGAAALLMSVYPNAATSQIKAALLDGANKNNNPLAYPYTFEAVMEDVEYEIDDNIEYGLLSPASRDEKLEYNRQYYLNILPGPYVALQGKGNVSENGLLDVKSALDLLGQKISNAEDLSYPENEYYDNYDKNNNNNSRYRRSSSGGCNAGIFAGLAGFLTLILILCYNFYIQNARGASE